MSRYISGTSDSVVIKEVSYFRSVLLEGSHCIKHATLKVTFYHGISV